jgi:hypothetical protein
LTNRYFLKVNGEQHCADGFCKSRDKWHWEGGEISLPTSGPVLARRGKRVTAPQIQIGDELWIWTHESKQHGNGRGLCAKATAGGVFSKGPGPIVLLKNVEIIPRPFGYSIFPKNPVNGHDTGSRLLDYTSTQRGYAVYYIEDEDYSDFVSLVEQRGMTPPQDQNLPAEFTWRSEVRQHKDEILSDLTERRLNWQKVRAVQGRFRDDLFDLYGGKCLLTRCAVPEALEAAHVLPHNGDPVRDRPDNGLLLRRDLHTMLDAMLWSIDPKTNKVRLARRLNDKSYGALDGKVIDHHVDTDALLVHFTQFQKADNNV